MQVCHAIHCVCVCLSRKGENCSAMTARQVETCKKLGRYAGVIELARNRVRPNKLVLNEVHMLSHAVNANYAN